jgi:hypothetical protein
MAFFILYHKNHLFLFIFGTFLIEKSPNFQRTDANFHGASMLI